MKMKFQALNCIVCVIHLHLSLVNQQGMNLFSSINITLLKLNWGFQVPIMHCSELLLKLSAVLCVFSIQENGEACLFCSVFCYTGILKGLLVVDVLWDYHFFEEWSQYLGCQCASCCVVVENTESLCKSQWSIISL